MDGETHIETAITVKNIGDLGNKALVGTVAYVQSENALYKYNPHVEAWMLAYSFGDIGTETEVIEKSKADKAQRELERAEFRESLNIEESW